MNEKKQMEFENEATRIRREILVRVTEAFDQEFSNHCAEQILYDMIPRDASEAYRCCVYKDREVVKHRCMAAMGFDVQDEPDEYRPLTSYALEAMDRSAIEGPVLTVLDIACQGCIRAQYTITNICRGCLARPCRVNCPVNCITITNGQAHIDAERCINCGKCKQVCPYHAVVHVPVPCEAACPVDAIRKDETGKERILHDRCISCGRCMRACPFGAVMEKSQIIDVLRAMKGPRRVVACCAPAIVGQFPGDMGQIAGALISLGFDSVVEVAAGADTTTRHEAREFLERMEQGEPFMTTSCCPAYMETVRKHVPELKDRVSETCTPMHYSAAELKSRDPDVVTVFIGPCVAKRFEALHDPMVDYVLTFEELGSLFVARDIEVAVCEEGPLETVGCQEGRGFAVSGGVASAIQAYLGEKAMVKPVLINGLSHEGLAQFVSYAEGKCPGNIVEVMACEGGCIGGAGVVGNRTKAAACVRALSEKSAHLPKEES